MMLRFGFGWVRAMTFALMMLAGATAAEPAKSGAEYFLIRVVDEQTKRGVPLVELQTVNHVSHVTDSAGVIALREPDMLGREFYFHVRGDGYEYPKDGFGYRGLKLVPRAGESVTVTVRRTNVAERLYRITGGGIYRDSVLAELPVPLREPLLNAQVLGQDTVLVTPYRGKLYWFWGDTEQAGYPLGNFAAAGATSELPGRGGLAAGTGVDLRYFVGAKGFAKPMCPDFGPGLHWIESVFTVPDEAGRERLVARVSSQHGLVKPYAWHLAVWNDEKEVFESKVKWAGGDGHDAAHPFRAKEGGVEYVYLYPNLRVRAELGSALDPKRYEAFTCIAGDGVFRGAETSVERDGAGALRYAWKAGADRLDGERVKQLVAAGRLRPEESWRRVRDFVSGRAFEAGRGSVFWNAFRQRWIMIMGMTAGEVWFGEAEAPTGPWGYVRQIVAHEAYNFYNVTQHPFYDEDGGRVIYFEGTYTASFSAAKAKTPRYDYNQIMYRVALDDPRLTLPRAVYRKAGYTGTRLSWGAPAGASGSDVGGGRGRDGEIAFYALSPGGGRGVEGVVTVRQDGNGRLSVGVNGGAAGGGETKGREEWGELIFLALPPQGRGEAGAAPSSHVQPVGETPSEFRSSAIVPLYAYRRMGSDEVRYATEPAWPEPGFVREAEPVCRVWVAR